MGNNLGTILTVFQVVMWRLKAPEKKPLVRRQNQEDKNRPIRRASQRRPNASMEMSNFTQDV